VNLARRNQSLLDRQIGFLDQLEAAETDPDALENLFKLDHLATRMRRNAESLLVLAGIEAPRRWGKPVALGDVVRAAVGEVEDYSRVHVAARRRLRARQCRRRRRPPPVNCSQRDDSGSDRSRSSIATKGSATSCRCRTSASA
jgi:hypothetical protein